MTGGPGKVNFIRTIYTHINICIKAPMPPAVKRKRGEIHNNLAPDPSPAGDQGGGGICQGQNDEDGFTHMVGDVYMYTYVIYGGK